MSVSFDSQMTLIKRRLVSGGTVATISLGINSILVLLINSILAKELTPAELGNYMLIVSLSVVMSTLPQLGLQRIVVREVAYIINGGSNKSGISTVYSMMFFLLPSCFISFFIIDFSPDLLFEWLFYENNPKLIHFSMPFLVSLWALRNVTAEAFRGFHMIGWASFHSRLHYNGLLFLFLLSFYTSNLDVKIDLEYILQITIGVSCFTAIVSLWHIGLKAGRTFVTDGKPKLRIGILKGGGAITISALLLMTSQEAHLWVLSNLVSSSEAAIYGVASKIGLLVGMPTLVISGVVPQIIAGLKDNEFKDKRNAVIQLVTIVAFFVALIAISALTFFGDYILLLGFGDRYVIAYQALLLVGISQGLLCIFTPLGQLMIVQEKERMYAIFTIVSSFLGIAITGLLSKEMGHVAAGYGMLTGAFVQVFSIYLYSVYKLDFKMRFSAISILANSKPR